MGDEINIAFVCTAYGPLWAPAVSSWLRVIAYTSRSYAISSLGRIGGAGISDRMYTHTAENYLVMEMLSAEPRFSHIFMTEQDMILPHDAITKLVALDKDIASGVYFLRAGAMKDAGQPCLYKRAPIDKDYRMFDEKKRNADYMHTPVKVFPTDAPFRVDCAGLGCVLIKRKVFDSFPHPWFDLKAGSTKEYGYGSDIHFYKHAKDAGQELWVDPTVQCGQIDYYETDIEDYKWQMEHDPKFASRGYIIGHAEAQEASRAGSGGGTTKPEDSGTP